MTIIGGQFCSGFKERLQVVKELEKLYKNKVQITCQDNFIYYIVYLSSSQAAYLEN